MATTSSNGKIAYIYDAQTDTWYPVAGTTNTSANFEWNGSHTFKSAVSFENVLKSQGGVNNFQNPVARDAAITAPTNGTVAFVRQDDLGNVINQIQYYHNSIWREYNDSVKLVDKIDNYQLLLSDAGKTVTMTSASDKTITVPANSTTSFIAGQKIEIIRNGAGEVSISPETGVVIINSKNSNKRIASRYSGAVLLKTDTNNTWILIGDLKA
jgi:hypothetical protein